MGLVDYLLRKPRQKTVIISTYEKCIVAKLDAIKCSAKRFLLNAENYNDFSAINPGMKMAAKIPHSIDNLCSEFAPKNCKYSKTTKNDNTIRELTQNNSHSSNIIETTNITYSLFALNRPSNQLKQLFSIFKQFANTFQTVLMMSQSEEETLSKKTGKHHRKFALQMKQALPQPHQRQQTLNTRYRHKNRDNNIQRRLIYRCF